MSPPFPYAGEVFSLICAIAWATAVIFFRVASVRVSPISINLFKDALSLPLIAAALAVVGRLEAVLEISSADLLSLGVSSLMGLVIGDTLLFMSLKRIGASLPFLLSCLYSPLVVLGAWLFLGETLPKGALIGGITITCGIALVSTDRLSMPDGTTRRDIVLGIIFGTSAPACFAAGVILLKNPLLRVDSITATFVRNGIATLLLALYMVTAGREREIREVFLPGSIHRVLLPGAFIAGFLGMILWIAGLRFTSASIASMLNQTVPLFGVPLAALFLQEQLTSRKIWGTALALAGIFMLFLLK